MVFGIDFGDPLLFDVDGVAILIVLLKTLLAFTIVLTAVSLMIWYLRKQIAGMQNRIGPNIAGPWGLLQTLADGIKLFTKEDLVPERADRFVFKLAPYLSAVPAIVTFSIVPLGGDFEDKAGIVHIFGRDTIVQLADPPVGILLMIALSSIAVYGVMLAGWSSGSKYPLLGAVRASAQMVSYEAALGLAVASVILVTGTLSTRGIVLAQDSLRDWNIVATGFLPFVIFFIAVTAELTHPPFDLVEAEQEIVGGFHTEYSSIRFALFFLAEFMNVITMSAIIVTLFLGGPAGPTLFGPDLMWGPIWFFAKVFCFLFIFVWFRATLPRFRYDQLMDLGWKALIPLALGWLLLLAGIQIARDEDWNWLVFFPVALAVFLAAYTLLGRAVRTSRDERAASDGVEVFD
ncbi:MAG: NADH-quinone oxidoreductase subunit NuoH [Acidimicrobiales bacterium]